MSWMDYYELLEKYDGDLSRATREEMTFAAKCNPNDPPTARALAEREWGKKAKVSADRRRHENPEFQEGHGGCLVCAPNSVERRKN